MNLIEQSKKAKQAEKQLRTLSNEVRNQILTDFADNLMQNTQWIMEENRKDLLQAKKDQMKESMIDRLTLNEERIRAIADGIRVLCTLEDPLHIVLEERTIRSGIRLEKVTCPIGVIGIIFESRPNVSADCAALCIKSGNACVLKGGKESYLSCLAIIAQAKKALKTNGVSEDAVMLAEKPTHAESEEWMKQRECVDLLIPRGGKKLIQSVVNNAKVPVIETGAGVCHIYIDKSAQYQMSEDIVINAKCQRPSVCNAMETLLIHKDIAQEFLMKLCKALEEHHVEIYGDEASRSIVENLKEADEESWYTEYNALIMNLKVVSSVEEAIDHIEKYGTHHSEAIITEDEDAVLKFFNGIDSACVYHNASTRFTDGYEFGLGAEIGISTQKLHARGPMGLRELTTYTYHLKGNGEVR